MNYDVKSSPPVDEVNVSERIARLQTRSVKKDSKLFALELAMKMIDLTTLEGMDTPGKVKQLCAKAKLPYYGDASIPKVAAVCVYPTLVSVAKKELQGTGINVAAVATAFPSGLAPLSQRLEDVRFAVDEGADEIDMVISRGAFLEGNYPYVFDEIAAVKEACRAAHLKVILETGELKTLDNVRRASDLAIAAGADFIKTSTGKVQPGATLPVTLVMLEAIRDHYLKTGIKIGMKPAGGIRDTKTALQYLVTVRETLGNGWLDPHYFRFGASVLANDLLMQIFRQRTGIYQSKDYFSID